MLLLDAGIWVASGTTTSRWHAPSRELVHKPPQPLGALDLTLYEIANVTGVLGRDPDAAETLVQILRRRCRGRLLALDANLLSDLLTLAAQHRLSAYDAAYVAAARRHGWQLVSIDHRDLVSKGLAVTPDAALYP